jgi:hypothetical protein
MAFCLTKNIDLSWAWCYIPIIPDTPKVDVGRTEFMSSRPT